MPADQSKTTEDQEFECSYTIARIRDAMRLARGLSCSQGSTVAVTLRVIVDQLGETSSLVSVQIEARAADG